MKCRLLILIKVGDNRMNKRLMIHHLALVIVKAEPIVKTGPIVKAEPIVKTGPIVKAEPIVRAVHHILLVLGRKVLIQAILLHQIQAQAQKV